MQILSEQNNEPQFVQYIIGISPSNTHTRGKTSTHTHTHTSTHTHIHTLSLPQTRANTHTYTTHTNTVFLYFSPLCFYTLSLETSALFEFRED